ncbi:MAG: hypothetical protein EAX90_06890 [Candidatus Heimdallarchaeota archaeon]|nr:hypothetical protein [Candidatus Heimdallarchaeota archaeon]
MFTKFISQIINKLKSKFTKESEIQSDEKKRESFFKKLGAFVTKKYKIILVLSLLLVISAIYPAILLQGELKYNDQDFLPQNLESDIGESIFLEQFNTNLSRGTTIIVLDSDEPIGTTENIEYLLKFTDSILESDYSDIVARVDSVKSACDDYNATYWSEMESSKELINDMIIENVTYANSMIYDSIPELNLLLQQIAGLYLMTWFNFSRTYYFGLYDTNLFTSGPSNGIVIFTIGIDTDFTEGFRIGEDYINLVYDETLSSLDDYTNVNDQIMNELAFNISNSMLKQYAGMTDEEYQTQIYPIFDYFYQKWISSFQTIITDNSLNIIDGTNEANNIYQHNTIFNSYISQGSVINHLLDVNASAFQEINLKELIISQAYSFFDFSDPEIMSMLSEEDINETLGLIYDLGPNPSAAEINSVAESLTNQIFQSILNLYPPIVSYEDFCTDEQYTEITKWVLSEDGKTAVIQISYDVSFYTNSEEKDEILVEADSWVGKEAHLLLEETGLNQTRVYHTGEIIIRESIMGFSEEAASKVDIVAVILVIVILLFVFKSLVAPFIPLITIGIAIAISFAFLFLVSQSMDIHYMSTMLLSIVSLGAGVDYCIFIFSRYQEELKKGVSKEEAVKTAIEHAGESVFHSGLTVMVGFGALIIPNFPLLRSLGISMVIGIGFSIIASILVVPSLLMVLGDAVFWPKALQRILQPKLWLEKLKKKKNKEEEISTELLEQLPEGQSITTSRKNPEEITTTKNESFILKLGKFVTNKGLIFFVITLVVFAPFAYFTFQMKTSTDFMSMMPTDFPQRDASNLLAEKMSFGNPIAIQILFYDLNYEVLNQQTLKDIEILCNNLLENEYVKTIRTVSCPLGMTTTIEATGNINADYLEVMQNFVGKDNHTFYMDIYLNVDAYSDEANDFVSNLSVFLEETIQKKKLTQLSSNEHYILGVTREFYEMNEVTFKSYPIVVPIVIIGVFLVLFFLFGSYFTPIRLILTIGLSIIFSLSMLYLIYGLGLGVPIFFLLPIMLFSILMGLGLDYDIFLVTRIKEYCEAGMTDKDAIVHALEHTATIITSCGFVMAAAFSSLMFTPLWHISELGFAFTLSIILDATFVRLILVPSIMVLAEKYNWTGPKKLQKIKRNPLVTSVMKTLGDTIGVEIYTRHMKESLEKIVEESSNKTHASNLLDDMMPIISGFIDEEKITTSIIDQMTESLEKVISL